MLFFVVLGVWGLHGEAQDARRVVINEIAWSGTAANARDEWVELVNNTDRSVDLSGWVLRWEDVVIHFGPVSNDVANNALDVKNALIPARGFYLLERTDDSTISDVEADLIYTGNLKNAGNVLELVDGDGNVVDTANAKAQMGWFAGSAGGGDLPYASMERISARGPDRADNWASNTGKTRNGLDAEGNALNATPKARNSTRR